MKFLSRRHRIRLASVAVALSSVGASTALIAAPAAHAASTAVTTSAVNMRSGASTKYGVITVVPSGAKVTVTGSSTGAWTPVSYAGRHGYISMSYLKASTTAPAPRPAKPTSSTRTTTADLNVRTGPSTKYAVVGAAPKGTKVSLTGVTSGAWVQITWKGATRWVFGSYLSSGAASAAQGATPRVAEPLAATASVRQQAVVDYAMAQLGDAYVWGGNGPNGYDCSGLTYMAYRQIGVSLPRVSADQANVGTAVSRADLQPGDLIFFNTPVNHVAMYIGNGKMVHARNYTTGVTTNAVDDYARWAPIHVIRRYV